MAIIKYTHAFEASDESELWDKVLSEQQDCQFIPQSWDELKNSKDQGVVIVTGGDGSLNGVVSRICEEDLSSQVKILYCPGGTGNDFARSVQLSNLDHGGFVNLMTTDSYGSVCVGKMNDNYFVNMATAGTFADITPEVSQESKAVLGRWAYYLKGIQSIPESKAYNFRFRVENSEWIKHKAIGFFVANAPYAGGGVQVAPDAAPMQKQLDFLIVDERPISELISFALELQKDSPNLDGFPMKIKKIAKVEFDCDEAITVNLDGERVKAKRGIIEMTSLRVKIFMPAVSY